VYSSLILTLACCLLGYLILVMGGLVSGYSWVPGSELDTWIPQPWPQEHTDERGRVLSYQDASGRWQNPWMKDRPSPAAFFYDWFIAGQDESGIPSQAKLDETLPVKEPFWMNTSNFVAANARLTWLGHATVLAEVDGAVILTDPIFSPRASAVQFAGPKRYRRPACRVKELPKLTAVLISHNHYDHLDLNSVRTLAELQPNISWFVPMGMGDWLRDNTPIPKVKVRELVWWDEVELEREEGNNLSVVFTPANHWCKRTLTDDNMTLWGSWAVLGPNHKFWFGGDTAYCEAFAQIGEQYGPFDIAAIPIGAYQPNWFMKYQHVHPGEALLIHKDIKSRRSLGIHWGTFKLTTEHYLEPPVLLTSVINRSELDSKAFVTTDIGGSIVGVAEPLDQSLPPPPKVST